METLLHILIGLGLAAACGFRVFVPLLIMGLASANGHLELTDGFEWIGSTPAIAVFAFATLVEVAGYYIPGVDHLLDALATPAAVIAGSVATASMVGDMSPMMTWSLAIIGGGGTAGAVQIGTVKLRAVSGMTTGGLGNPIVSTGELAGSVATPLLAMVVPVAAAVLIALFFLWVIRAVLRRKSVQPPSNTSHPS